MNAVCVLRTKDNILRQWESERYYALVCLPAAAVVLLSGPQALSVFTWCVEAAIRLCNTSNLSVSHLPHEDWGGSCKNPQCGLSLETYILYH